MDEDKIALKIKERLGYLRRLIDKMEVTNPHYDECINMSITLENNAILVRDLYRRIRPAKVENHQPCPVCDSFGCCPSNLTHTYKKGCLLEKNI